MSKGIIVFLMLLLAGFAANNQMVRYAHADAGHDKMESGNDKMEPGHNMMDSVKHSEDFAPEFIRTMTPAGYNAVIGSKNPLEELEYEFVSTRRKMENKVGAAFATGGHHTGGKETTMISILQCMLIYGMIIVGDPMDASGHYGVGCVGSPDDTAAGDGFKLGKRVAEVCAKLQG